MAKGHRSQVKKARNEQNKDRRPQAHVKFVRISDTKARIVLDQIKMCIRDSICCYSNADSCIPFEDGFI